MLTDVSENNSNLVLTGVFDAAPEQLFRYWTEPALLATWWTPDAEIEPAIGGRYRMSWPAMDRHLRGSFLTYEPGQRLTFTWKFDHEPDMPERTVDVRFEPDGTGTRLTVTHSSYSESDVDQQDRQGHQEGWLYFGERLASAISPA